MAEGDELVTKNIQHSWQKGTGEKAVPASGETRELWGAAVLCVCLKQPHTSQFASCAVRPRLALKHDG